MSSRKRRDKYVEESKRKDKSSEEEPTEDEARVLGEESREEDDDEEETTENRRSDSEDRPNIQEDREEREESPRREERESPVRTRKQRKRSKEREPFHIVGEITSYFDNKFSSLRKELLEEHDNITERIDKRLKPEKDFKRKTNKFQYEHNTDMTASMKKAKKYLQKTPPNIKKAVSVLDSGIKENKFRTKCILIADKAEGGWATVEEYMQRELASDSEDDRRLRKAEQSVARKMESKKQPYKPRYKPYTKGKPHSNNHYNHSGYNNNYNNQYDNGFNRFNRHQEFSGNSWNHHGRRRREGCFICGDHGHWKDRCPRSFIPAAAGGPS